jgi:hypothetical protein
MTGYADPTPGGGKHLSITTEVAAAFQNIIAGRGKTYSWKTYSWKTYGGKTYGGLVWPRWPCKLRRIGFED